MRKERTLWGRIRLKTKTHNKSYSLVKISLPIRIKQDLGIAYDLPWKHNAYFLVLCCPCKAFFKVFWKRELWFLLDLPAAFVFRFEIWKYYFHHVQRLITMLIMFQMNGTWMESPDQARAVDTKLRCEPQYWIHCKTLLQMDHSS